jgi:type I restriction enzyme S subunit
MAGRMLGQIAEIVMGQSPPGHMCNTVGEGTPLLNGPTEFGEPHPSPVQYTSSPTRFAHKGDLLFCVRGSTTGRMNWADQEYAIGRGVAAIRHKNGYKYQPYLRALVQYLLPELLGVATGSTFPSVSKPQLNQIECNIPDEPTQYAIANILGGFDDKIDLLRRQNKTLESIAQNLFKEWFVKFRVNGKQLPLDRRTGLPYGWKQGRLGDVAVNVREGVSVNRIQDNKYYVGLEHLERKHLALYNWSGTDKIVSNKSLFARWDILFGKLRAYFHKVCFAPIDGICSTDILVIRPKSTEYFSLCLMWFFDENVVRYSDASSSGTRMPRTSWNILVRYEIPIPDVNVVFEFNQLIIPMIAKIEKNIHTMKCLIRLRDLLLPRLMKGEIRAIMQKD